MKQSRSKFSVRDGATEDSGGEARGGKRLWPLLGERGDGSLRREPWGGSELRETQGR